MNTETSADRVDLSLQLPDGPVRRHLVLLFIDLSASSFLAEQLEAEHFAEILQSIRGVCRATMARHGGHIVRAQGDGVLAIFGFPEPAENDGRRACEAALEVHAQVARLAPVALPEGSHTLQMHSGIHAGLVLISEGDLERGRLELVGDAPNTAARLSAFAPAGTIYADVQSLGPSLNFFTLASDQLLMLPGRSTPVRVVSITGRTSATRRFDATSLHGVAPLLGREQVVARVCASLSAAKERGATQIVQVRGEAGIGKTRLLEELDRHLSSQGWWCLRGSCENLLRTEAQLPFTQMLSQAQADSGAHRTDLTNAAAVKSDFVSLLASSPPLQPLLLIDDWQWADDASRQLLSALQEQPAPLMLVLATRGLHGPAEARDGALRFDLDPFNESETQATVDRWAPGTDPFVVTEIHQYAGGIPLLVEEICHTVRSQGAMAFRAMRKRGVRAGAPGWMSSMVATRLGQLTLRQQALVRAAAVMGTMFPRALFVSVVPGPVVSGEVEALAQADFLFQADSTSLRFKHGLTRDAVYDLVPLEERRALHAAVVAVLQQDAAGASATPTLELLAHHTAAAGLWDQATHCSEAAGDKAMQAFALDLARAHYQAAIQAADRVGDVSRAAELRWCSLVHKLGMTCIFDTLALPDVMPLFERCLQRAGVLGEPQNEARSAYWLGYLSYGFGRPRQATRHLRTALRLAGVCGDLRLATQVDATLGQALAATTEYDESIERMDRALVVKRQGARTGSAVAVGSAFTLACKASVLADRGDFLLAHAALDQARVLVGSSLHPVANSVRSWTMVILAWQGRWDDTLVVVDESIRIAERTRALLPLAIARAAGGYARWMRDGTAAHVEEIAEAVRWMEERRCSFFTSIYYGWLVEACQAQGDAMQTRRHAARLVLRARAGECLGEAAGWRALALQAQQAHRAENQVERYLARALAAGARRRSRRELALNDLCRADILRLQGRDGPSGALRRTAGEALLQMGMQWHASSCAAP